jgi:putative flippase GtrA
MAASKLRWPAIVDPWLPAMVRFGVKGLGGLALTVALLTVAVDVVGISRALAVPVVVVVKLVPGYLVVDKWVFGLFDSPDGVTGHGKRGVIHYAIQWLGKGGNYLIYLALIETGVLYQGAWVVGAVVVFPLIFAANWWVWGR